MATGTNRVEQQPLLPNGPIPPDMAWGDLCCVRPSMKTQG